MSRNNDTNRSHGERFAAACQTYQRFVPGAQPEQVARSFAERMGAMGTFAFETVGDMWNRPALNRRDRSLMIIATLAAQSRDEELIVHTQIGLRHGLTRSEIEEVRLHIAAYAGFPAAMAAGRQIDEGLRRAEGVEQLSARTGAVPKSDEQRDTDAARVLAELSGQGEESPQDLASFTRRYGHLGENAFRWIYGEIWARDELSARDRSLVTLAIVICLGADTLMQATLQMALQAGLTLAEMEEVIAHLGLYAGLVQATRAMEAWRQMRDAHPGAQA